ncbi:MAG: deoxynucleoside kinase [Candidatus Micrarchaeaceae archaeon]
MPVTRIERFAYPTWSKGDADTAEKPREQNPIHIAFTGKPCSGKTTYAHLLSEDLNHSGILTLDAKEYMQNHTIFGRVLDSTFRNIENRNDAISGSLSVLKHVLSYALSLGVLSVNENDYKVVITQRVYPDFAFALDTVLNSNASITRAIQSLSLKAFNPDIIVYLHAEEAVLDKRMEKRTDGKDPIHRLLMRTDDSPLKSALKQWKKPGAVYIEMDTSDSSKTEQNIRALSKIVSSLIRV